MNETHTDHQTPGSHIIEQLTLELPEVETAAARRAWTEATTAWPGDPSARWWKWVCEASASIGQVAQPLDCTVRQAVDLVRGGTSLISWKPSSDGSSDEGIWLYARPASRRRIEVCIAGPEVTKRRVRPGQFRRLLRGWETEGRLRCVVLRHDMTTTSQIPGQSPFSRLLSLLQPEWSDIWIVLVFAFVVGLLTLATPIAVEALVNTVAFGRLLQPVVVLAVMLLSFLAFSAAMRALQIFVVEIIQRRLFARVAGDLAYRLPRVVLRSVDNTYLPELTNRFFDVVTLQKITAQLLLDGLGLVLTASIGMSVLAFYHPWLLGFDVFLMAAIVIIIVVLGRGAIPTAIVESKRKYQMAAWLEDVSRCMVTFRSSGGPDLSLQHADKLICDYLAARQKHFRILIRQMVSGLALQALASTILLGLGGWLVISGQLSLGQLVAAELIVTSIVGAVAKLGKHLDGLYDLLAAVDKLGTLFDLPVVTESGILQMKFEGAPPVTATRLRYSERSIFDDGLSFSIPAGATYAVCGRSGSGKSTLLELIYGLRVPTSGFLTIAGFDPADLRPDVLRHEVSFVRGGEVFEGTIADNVHMQRPDVSSADVRHVLEQVGLYEQVLSLPDGFNTRLNSDGRPLSDRQCDLLALARGIAGRPRLLLIDGLLDALSDEELNQVINVLTTDERPWTLIIATGREDIARRCNHILRLDGPDAQRAAPDAKSPEENHARTN